MYLGDFKEDGDIFFKFTTRAFATGIPTLLDGSPVLSVYKDEGGAGTEKTTAEAYFDLDVDHDSIAGWNNVRIDLSGDAFFATGADYSVVITTGTVDSVNVFGENLANFSIENRSMGQPAGATLAADIAAIKAETALIVGDTGTDGVKIAAGALTDATLAGGMEIVFETDFGTNYNTTRNAWATNVQDQVGTGNLTTNVIQIEGADATDQINAACDASIETYGLDHLISAAVAGADVADDSIIAQMVDDAATADWDGYDNTTASLEALNVDTDKIIDLVNGLGGSTGGSVSIQTLLDNTVTGVSINNGGAAVDKGTSPETVGIPVTGHAFVAEQQVTLANTASNDGSFDVDSVSVNEVVIIKAFVAETFGADDTISSTVKTIGFIGSVQAGTVASTEALDGVLHDIDDVGDDIDLVYTFNVGAGRTGTEIIFHGFVQGNGDTIDIEVYDHVGTDWEILRTITGSNGTNNITLEVPLLLKHTGTSGLDTGRVYVRYDTNVTTPSNLSIDQLLVEAINTGNLNAYENGQIWIDTKASNTNTVADVDGTSRRPVSTIAAAKTLSTSTGLGDFHVINGSSFTLAESTVNESYFGDNWTLALGSQDVDGAYFQGAHVSGIGTSATEVHFEGCDIGTMSVQIGHFDFCSFDGTVTQTLAGDYEYHNCYSNIAGVGAPIFTKTAGQAITAEWRNWMDSITVSGLQSGDTITINGRLGTVTLNGADATVEIRGSYKSIVNNLTGSPTVNTDGAWKGKDIADTLADTNELQGDDVPGLIAALNDFDPTAQLVESYAANGVAPTTVQLQFAMHQYLMQFGISATSYTVRKLDDATTAFVVTLDDDTNPTDAKRV